MANLEFNCPEGQIEYSIYSKENTKTKLGVKRTAFDLINQGDIDERLFWILKVKTNNETDDKIAIEKFVEANIKEVILANPGVLTINKLSLYKEQKILEAVGFKDVKLKRTIDGFMNVNMFYANAAAEGVINKLRTKKLIVE